MMKVNEIHSLENVKTAVKEIIGKVDYISPNKDIFNEQNSVSNYLVLYFN